MKNRIPSQSGHYQICGKTTKESSLMPAFLIRPAVAALIKKANRGWDDEG
jgi:hypothetical protein